MVISEKVLKSSNRNSIQCIKEELRGKEKINNDQKENKILSKAYKRVITVITNILDDKQNEQNNEKFEKKSILKGQKSLKSIKSIKTQNSYPNINKKPIEKMKKNQF